MAAPAENILRTITGSLLQGEALYSPGVYRGAVEIFLPELSPALQRISTAILAALLPNGTVNADAVSGALNGSISDRYLLDQLKRAEYPALIDSELRLTEILRAREDAAQDRELDEFLFQQGAAPQAAPAKAPEAAPAQPGPEVTILENMRPRSVLELLADTSLTEPEPVFEGLMAVGEVTVVGGPPKAMKSWTVKSVGLCAATGAPWLGFPCPRPFRVLLLSAEGREVRLRERFQKLIGFTPVEEAGLAAMEYISTLGRLKIDTSAGQRALLRIAAPFDVVILDPLYRFIAEGDENSHRDARRVQDVLDQIKGQGKAIVIVHHVRKPGVVSSGISELRGAGLDGYVDGAIILSRLKEDSDDRFRMEFCLRNFESPPPMDLVREGVVLLPATKKGVAAPTNIPATEVVRILGLFGGEMAGGDLSAQLVDLRGVSKATAARAIAAAVTPPGNPVDWRPAGGRGNKRIYYVVTDEDGGGS